MFRAPREPNLSKSEPFQIKVKLGLLDQKMGQNRNMMILEHEKVVQVSLDYFSSFIDFIF